MDEQTRREMFGHVRTEGPWFLCISLVGSSLVLFCIWRGAWGAMGLGVDLQFSTGSSHRYPLKLDDICNEMEPWRASQMITSVRYLRFVLDLIGCLTWVPDMTGLQSPTSDFTCLVELPLSCKMKLLEVELVVDLFVHASARNIARIHCSIF